MHPEAHGWPGCSWRWSSCSEAAKSAALLHLASAGVPHCRPAQLAPCPLTNWLLAMCWGGCCSGGRSPRGCCPLSWLCVSCEASAQFNTAHSQSRRQAMPRIRAAICNVSFVVVWMHLSGCRGGRLPRAARRVRPFSSLCSWAAICSSSSDGPSMIANHRIATGFSTTAKRFLLRNCARPCSCTQHVRPAVGGDLHTSCCSPTAPAARNCRRPFRVPGSSHHHAQGSRPGSPLHSRAGAVHSGIVLQSVQHFISSFQ